MALRWEREGRRRPGLPVRLRLGHREYALNSAANLRHVAECVAEGDEGCEWVYNSTMRELGKPEGPLQYADRYTRPFEGVPVLGRLIYDLATNKMEPVRVYP